MAHTAPAHHRAHIDPFRAAEMAREALFDTLHQPKPQPKSATPQKRGFMAWMLNKLGA